MYIPSPEEERADVEKRVLETIWEQLQEDGAVDPAAPLNPSVKFKEIFKKGHDNEIAMVFFVGRLRRKLEGDRFVDRSVTLRDPEMTIQEAAKAMVLPVE
ncbi:hypothetical protein AB0P41_11955 [Streptomyces sp. NPDC079167]|uniref:hypothetical protein n=1 Tax=Streptomyces sp. NPDC079167 TaxID=3154513 RepID=UPI0034293FAF